MTGEVVFSGRLLLTVWFRWVNRMHVSVGGPKIFKKAKVSLLFRKPALMLAACADRCSMCCYSVTRATPPGSCRPGRKAPRPGWRCSKRSRAGSSPGWRIRDLCGHTRWDDTSTMTHWSLNGVTTTCLCLYLTTSNKKRVYIKKKNLPPLFRPASKLDGFCFLGHSCFLHVYVTSKWHPTKIAEWKFPL